MLVLAKLRTAGTRGRPTFFQHMPSPNKIEAWLSTTCGESLPHGTIPKMGKGVQLGQFAEVERTFTAAQVATFGSLVQDKNFLHSSISWDEDMEHMRDFVPVTNAHLQAGLIKPEEDKPTSTRPLVHGMLVSSVFSSIFASLVPGCVYVNQTLHFSTPIFADDQIVGRVEIEKIRKWRKGGVVVQCVTDILSKEERSQLIRGTANVWLPEGHEGHK